MAARILITCKSNKVPGPDKDKTMLLANQACQKVWARDFDVEIHGDRLTMEGEFSWGVRCSLLIDNGPVESKDYTISFFRWNGQELVLEPLPLFARKRLEEKYQFDPANRPQRIRYTDEEFKRVFCEKKYDELMRAKAERKEIVKRFGGNQP